MCGAAATKEEKPVRERSRVGEEWRRRVVSKVDKASNEGGWRGARQSLRARQRWSMGFNSGAEGGRSGGQLLQEEVKEGSVEGRQLQQEALACRRFHSPLQLETLEPLGGRHHGLQAPGGDPAAHDRQ